jgi:hypothetical protein
MLAKAFEKKMAVYATVSLFYVYQKIEYWLLL